MASSDTQAEHAVEILEEVAKQADHHTMLLVLGITGASEPLEDQPWIRQSIELRSIYTDPLNFLQAELLFRQRRDSDRTTPPDAVLEQAIMVTIAGVAAGMRNTG